MPNKPLFAFKPATMMQEGTMMRRISERDIRKRTKVEKRRKQARAVKWLTVNT
jgi:hypothetical protein